MEVVDLAAVARPQCDVVDADGLIGVAKLHSPVAAGWIPM